MMSRRYFDGFTKNFLVRIHFFFTPYLSPECAQRAFNAFFWGRMTRTIATHARACIWHSNWRRIATAAVEKGPAEMKENKNRAVRLTSVHLAVGYHRCAIARRVRGHSPTGSPRTRIEANLRLDIETNGASKSNASWCARDIMRISSTFYGPVRTTKSVYDRNWRALETFDVWHAACTSPTPPPHFNTAIDRLCYYWQL